MKLLLKLLAIGLVGLLILTVRYLVATTPAINSENGIARLERVRIGGADQWLLLRGNDVTKPVLLFVHGGPGFAEMVLSRRLNQGLERHFIVVNWDQRGAGKSYAAGRDEKQMTAEQVLSDTHEIVQYLKKRFRRDKIFIMGHSWGSFLGLKTAYRYPGDFYAYIGVGQVVNGRKGDTLSYQWTQRMAAHDKNKKALQELGALQFVGGIYQNGMAEKHVQRKWLRYYKGYLRNLTMQQILSHVILATEYTLWDKVNQMKGTEYSEAKIGERWLENLRFDEEITRIAVPIFFIQGKYDYNTPSSLVRAFYAKINAPRKEYLEFQNSAHAPNFEEPKRFTAEMARISEAAGKR